MPLTIDTFGQSLPTEVRSAINELSAIFLEDCRVSILDGSSDFWQVKVWQGQRVRIVNLDGHHQTIRDIQLALREIRDSFADHCHDCPRTDYLLKCQGNDTITCVDWVCPRDNEGTTDRPRCTGCYVMPFAVSLGTLGVQP